MQEVLKAELSTLLEGQSPEAYLAARITRHQASLSHMVDAAQATLVLRGEGAATEAAQLVLRDSIQQPSLKVRVVCSE